MAEGSGRPPDGCDDPSVQLLERLAHDLRGPLAPLQTATWLLRQDGAAAPRRDDLLDIIDRQSSRLGKMVQEISDWVRARDGRLISRKELLAVPLLLELAPATEQGMPGWQGAQGLEDRVIEGDAQRLVQMLGTLSGVLQARGGISARTASVVGGRLRLAVIGEAAWGEGELDRLFSAPDPEPFDQGLGMRLLVAHEIARAHGGDAGAGWAGQTAAELWVELPLAG